MWDMCIRIDMYRYVCESIFTQLIYNFRQQTEMASEAERDITTERFFIHKKKAGELMKLRWCRCLSAGFSSRLYPLSTAQEAIIVLQVILTYAGRTKNKYIPIWRGGGIKNCVERRVQNHGKNRSSRWELRVGNWQLATGNWGLLTGKMGLFDLDPILVSICCPASLRMRKLHSKLSMKEDPSPNRTCFPLDIYIPLPTSE